MRVETTVDPSTGAQHKHYIGEAGEHLFVPGPVTGLMTLADGTKVNVTPDVILVADEAQAVELNDLIGRHWVEVGHPDDIDTLVDPETGAQVAVQRPFVFETSEGEALVGVGTPVGEHPLDGLQDAAPEGAISDDTGKES